MFLCIVFEYEFLPFILDNASEAECLQAIEKAKEMFTINRTHYVVESDRIILYAKEKKVKPKKRLYCLKEKVVLQTKADYSDEVDSTKQLLAYENNVAPEEIYAIEI